MESYKSLLDEHETLQRRREEDAAAGNADPAAVRLETAAIERFLEKVRQAGAAEEQATRRETLRHIALTWADVVQERTGKRPSTTIADYQPADGADLDEPPAYARPAPGAQTGPPSRFPPNRALPSQFWTTAGVLALALVLIFVTIVLTRDLFVSPPDAAQTTLPTVTTAAAATEAAPAEPSPTAQPLLEITVVATSTSAAIVAREYTVQPGDTLIGIATRYSIDLNLLRTVNGLSSDLLQPGQLLWIPDPGRELAPPAAPAVVTTPVVAGTPPTIGAPPAGGTAVPAELVVRGSQGLGTVTLRARPASTGEPITAVLPGTIALAVGRLPDNSWYLLELTDSRARGWLPAAEIGLIYPASPETVPVIELPR